jgi:hypothetical protein
MRQESKRCCRLFLFPGAFQIFWYGRLFFPNGAPPQLLKFLFARAQPGLMPRFEC